MSHYTIRQSPANGHTPSPLFNDLCEFVGAQPHGSLGWFDSFGPEPIVKEWDPEAADRLNANGFAFLGLADGSYLALLDTGVKGAPHAVVLLGSEGEHPTIANSLEEFIKLWAKGDTGVSDLDDEEADGRAALAAWFKSRGIKVPKAKAFDFGSWLDGNANATAAAPTQALRAPTEHYQQLGPKMRQLVDMMGRRADDPAVIDWVTNTLGKKVPAHTSSDSANVSVPKLGIELVFSHDVLSEKYEPIKKSARSFIPYLSHAWVREKFGEPIFGLDLKKGADEAAIEKALGAADGKRPGFMSSNEPTIAYWHRVVDSGADVVIEVEYDDGLGIKVTLDSAAELKETPTAGTHLFIGWAATNGLINESEFPKHIDLLNKVKNREALGADFAKAALPRGLWDSHLVDKPGLRRTAYQWFHRMAGLGMDRDFETLFGTRIGESGYETLNLDNGDWDKVDAADETLKKVFGKWL